MFEVSPIPTSGGRPLRLSFVAHALAVDGDFKRQLIEEINPAQARAIARFVRFMIATHTTRGDDTCGDSWTYAYRVYWRKWDAGNSRK